MSAQQHRTVGSTQLLTQVQQQVLQVQWVQRVLLAQVAVLAAQVVLQISAQLHTTVRQVLVVLAQWVAARQVTAARHLDKLVVQVLLQIAQVCQVVLVALMRLAVLLQVAVAVVLVQSLAQLVLFKSHFINQTI
jgi:hypothetical protein